MIVVYDSDFLKTLKKIDIRIKKKFKERILLFSNDPNDPSLRNHALKNEYTGYRSIDIDSDWRAIYENIDEVGESIAYFVEIGTHAQLYRKSKAN